MDPHLMSNFSDSSVALRFVFLTRHQRLRCVNVFISICTASSAAALITVDCSDLCQLHQELVDAALVQPLFGNCVIN